MEGLPALREAGQPAADPAQEAVGQVHALPHLQEGEAMNTEVAHLKRLLAEVKARSIKQEAELEKQDAALEWVEWWAKEALRIEAQRLQRGHSYEQAVTELLFHVVAARGR